MEFYSPAAYKLSIRNDKLNNSKIRVLEGSRPTLRSPGAKQSHSSKVTSANSSELPTQESPVELHQVSCFDWEQHLVRQRSEASIARYPAAQKSLLHGLCEHWMSLARGLDGRDATDDPQDTMQEVVYEPNLLL